MSSFLKTQFSEKIQVNFSSADSRLTKSIKDKILLHPVLTWSPLVSRCDLAVYYLSSSESQSEVQDLKRFLDLVGKFKTKTLVLSSKKGTKYHSAIKPQVYSAILEHLYLPDLRFKKKSPKYINWIMFLAILIILIPSILLWAINSCVQANMKKNLLQAAAGCSRKALGLMSLIPKNLIPAQLASQHRTITKEADRRLQLSRVTSLDQYQIMLNELPEIHKQIFAVTKQISKHTATVLIAILTQNPEWINPTGGINSELVLAKVAPNFPIELKKYQVTSLDQYMRGVPDPPAEFAKIMPRARWSLANSGWHPDMGRSAKDAAWFLSKQLNISPDLVVFINSDVFPSYHIGSIDNISGIFIQNPHPDTLFKLEKALTDGRVTVTSTNPKLNLPQVIWPAIPPMGADCQKVACIDHEIKILDTNIGSTPYRVARSQNINLSMSEEGIEYTLSLDYSGTVGSGNNYLQVEEAKSGRKFTVDNSTNGVLFNLPQPAGSATMAALRLPTTQDKVQPTAFRLSLPAQAGLAKISNRIVVSFPLHWKVQATKVPSIAKPGLIEYNDPARDTIELLFLK